MTLTMIDPTSALPIEDVREEAQEILSALDASRSEQVVFEGHWRRLWQLVREAKAAGMRLGHSDEGPWRLAKDGSHGDYGPAHLTAGEFTLPIWPPDASLLQV